MLNGGRGGASRFFLMAALAWASMFWALTQGMQVQFSMEYVPPGPLKEGAVAARFESEFYANSGGRRRSRRRNYSLYS